ncbi:MAG: 30S ribosomal protein S2 [Verrucomicrobia bacterium]|nr:30S ribosomal protein S2 [Cytophagales bacterium]
MAQLNYKELLDAGVHFGHLTRKWNPKMAPYIFMEKNGIHIIDLNKTLASMEEAQHIVKNIIRSGRKIMFVATKKQAQEVVSEEAKRLKMPFVTERWLGGMLTNFATIKKSLKKMASLDKLMKEDTFNQIAKKERLVIAREKDKLEKLLGGVAELTRTPAALFVVDIKREHIAIAEAKRLGIPIIGICDTNSNPDAIEYPIPGNDDAFKSIAVITQAIGQAVEEGLLERKKDKDDQKLQEEEEAKRAVDKTRTRKAKVVVEGDESEVEETQAEEKVVPVAVVDEETQS